MLGIHDQREEMLQKAWCAQQEDALQEQGPGLPVRELTQCEAAQQKEQARHTQLEDAPQEVRHAQQEHAWSEAQTHVQHV